MSQAEPPTPARRLRIRWYHALWIAAPILLALAARGVPLNSVILVLRRLSIAQISVLILVNLLILQVFAARWAIILGGLGHRVNPVQLMAYRTAGFSISYFTPGTQFGGEPLQAYLLYRRSSVPPTPAAASVAIDKGLELLGSYTFLAFGIVVSAQTSLLPGRSALPLLALALLILALPLLFVVAASRGARRQFTGARRRRSACQRISIPRCSGRLLSRRSHGRCSSRRSRRHSRRSHRNRSRR